MKFRRSKRTAVIVSVLLLLLIVTSMSRQHGNHYLSAPGRDLAALGRALFRSKNSYKFNTWADALFRKYLAQASDEDTRFSKYLLGREKVHEISAEKISLPNTNVNLTVFDPRFTLGVVLADLSRQLASGSSPAQLSLSAFHWADWTNCSEHQLLMVSRDAHTCERFRSTGSSSKYKSVDPYAFCFDDSELGKQSEAKARDRVDFASFDRTRNIDALYAGYHIFKNPGRTTSAIKITTSASYLYEFMPQPAGVIFLGASGNGKKNAFSVYVACNVTFRQRLIGNDVAMAAIKNGPLSLEAELSNFAANLKSKNGPFSSRAQKLSSQKPLHQVQLSHDDFVDNSTEIVEQLTNSELSGSLTPSEKSYLAALRMSLSTQDPSKYFHEANLERGEKNWALGGHYDWRFFKGLRYKTDVHGLILHGLISAWLRFSHAQNTRTWLAHGTLLSWFWSGTSFPWDADIDVQMPISDLHFLARNFNQTIVVDFGAAPKSELRMGRYFLDIGPWLSHRGPGTGQNSIDARFIDMDSGLYIDITALAVSSVEAPPRYEVKKEGEGEREKEGEKEGEREKEGEKEGEREKEGEKGIEKRTEGEVLGEKLEEKLDQEKLENEKLEQEKFENEKLEKEKFENERLENERLENERLEKEKFENERLEKEKFENERLEKEKLEKELFEKHTYEKNAQAQLYNCRNMHFSSLTEISPLLETYMEGVPAYVPSRFLDMLHSEYGVSSTRNERYKTYVFLPRLRLWADAQILFKLAQKKAKEAVEGESGESRENGESGESREKENIKELSLESINMKDFLGTHIIDAQRAKDGSSSNLNDEDYLKLLAMYPDLLKEYLVTRDYTEAHQKEMQVLVAALTPQDIENSDYFELLQVPERSMRRDVSGFLRAKTGWRFEDAQAQLDQSIKDSDSKDESIKQKKSVTISINPNGPAEQVHEQEKMNSDEFDGRFQKQSKDDARDPSITRPDQEQ